MKKHCQTQTCTVISGFNWSNTSHNSQPCVPQHPWQQPVW
jgi:hypothetical protein